LADISCGDAWHRLVDTGQPGWSLVLVRTERGKDILHKAMDAGYVKMLAGDLNTLVASQRSLLDKRRSIWGKLFALSLTGVPRPELRGFLLFVNWWDLPFFKKVRFFGGMLWRVVCEKLTQPIQFFREAGANNSSHSGKDIAAGEVERAKCKV
jgi:coenzyme F420 hydrogenase subunit beta